MRRSQERELGNCCNGTAGERLMGQARARPASNLLADESLVEGPQMLTLLFKDLSK